MSLLKFVSSLELNSAGFRFGYELFITTLIKAGLKSVYFRTKCDFLRWPIYCLSFKDVFERFVEIKLQNQCRKIRKAKSLCVKKSSHLNPIENQDSFNFIDTQEADWLIFAPKRPYLEVLSQYFCWMIDEEWISLALFVYIKVFNNRDEFFRTSFRLPFPQNAEYCQFYCLRFWHSDLKRWNCHLSDGPFCNCSSVTQITLQDSYAWSNLDMPYGSLRYRSAWQSLRMVIIMVT